jgi:hypothetical protein
MRARAWRRRLFIRLVIAAAAFLIASDVVAPPVFAAGSGHLAAAKVQNLNTVINNITAWLVGILVSLATLLLTVGGVRYLLAGGDPGEVNKAKDTLKYAAIGYGVAVLAPVLVTILKGFVGA